MAFWSTFLKESLQQPWVIGPEAQAVSFEEPQQQKVFVLTSGLPHECYAMVSKMILALKYKPQEVALVERDNVSESELQAWKDSKRVLFFGDNFPGSFGSFQNWQGHQTLKTHSLKDLLQRPELKKQTWEHLKTFASLK